MKSLSHEILVQLDFFLVCYFYDCRNELDSSKSVLNQCFLEGELNAIARIRDFLKENLK